MPNTIENPGEFVSRWAGISSLWIMLTGLAIIQLPFLGSIMRLLAGQAGWTELPFLIVDAIILTPCLFLSARFLRISFGYNKDGVFYRGVFKTIRIPWVEIREIVRLREYRVWNAIDLFQFLKIKLESNFAYRISSSKDAIGIPGTYGEAKEFASGVANILGLPIKNDIKNDQIMAGF